MNYRGVFILMKLVNYEGVLILMILVADIFLMGLRVWIWRHRKVMDDFLLLLSPLEIF